MRARLIAALAVALAVSGCSDGTGPASSVPALALPTAEEARVTSILPFGGVGAWVGTYDGTLALLGAATVIVDTPADPAWGSVRALADENADLVAAAGSGLFRLGGSGWETLAPSGDGALAISLVTGSDGVWMGRGNPATGSGSIALAGGEAWTLHDYAAVIQSASMVNQVVVDTDGGVWAATNAAG